MIFVGKNVTDLGLLYNAKNSKYVGIRYVKVSLDEVRELRNSFRRIERAFDRAAEGIKNARYAGIAMTVTRYNLHIQTC